MTLMIIYHLIGCWLLGKWSIRPVQGQSFPNVPGVVIDHLPKSTGNFIGPPSLVVLSNGRYVASHDIFGKSIRTYLSHQIEAKAGTKLLIRIE